MEKYYKCDYLENDGLHDYCVLGVRQCSGCSKRFVVQVLKIS